jgi:glucose-1-phosphate thymidylyltransferase
MKYFAAPARPAGVILAGGRGTRLAPLTDRTSKQLLDVGGEPMVVRVVRQLVRAGVRDVLIVIDERDADGFLAAVRDGTHLGLHSAAYVWQPATGAGIPSAVARAEPYLRADSFLVACGDVLLDADLSGFVDDFARQPPGARMLSYRTADTAGYTPLELDGALVTGLGDKEPERHGPGTVDLGIYLYRRDVFAEIRTLRPSARGETEIWELNRRYARRGLLQHTTVSGWWADLGGSAASYHAASRHYRASSLEG